MSKGKSKNSGNEFKRGTIEVTLLEIAELEDEMQLNPSVQSYEKALRRIPSSADYWLRYIDFLSEFPERALKLAERAVTVCPHIDVWRRLLSLSKDLCTLTEMLHVYSRFLHGGVCGFYKMGEIYLEYLYLLKRIHNHRVGSTLGESTSNVMQMQPSISTGECAVPLPSKVPANLPPNLLDEYAFNSVTGFNVDLSFIRQIYHTALSAPIDKLDIIYDDYQLFEQTVGAVAAGANTVMTAPTVASGAQSAGAIQSAKFITMYST